VLLKPFYLALRAISKKWALDPRQEDRLEPLYDPVRGQIPVTQQFSMGLDQTGSHYFSTHRSRNFIHVDFLLFIRLTFAL
jgi:hypothetical protein